MAGAAKSLTKLCLLLVIAGALSACGVRGSLESPPKPDTADAASGQGKPEGGAPKPHKGNPLDALIR